MADLDDEVVKLIGAFPIAGEVGGGFASLSATTRLAWFRMRYESISERLLALALAQSLTPDGASRGQDLVTSQRDRLVRGLEALRSAAGDALDGDIAHAFGYEADVIHWRLLILFDAQSK